MAFCLYSPDWPPGGDCDYVPGDVNGSDSYNGLDVTYGVNYFKGGSSLPTGEILHLVTTVRFSGLDDLRDGLFDVVYRFDKNAQTLFVSQRRFVERPTGLDEDREFLAAVDGVEYVGLTFLDGRQWLDEWDFRQKKKLPRAVRISIVCEDENGRQCSYGTTAYVYCLRSQNNK